MGAHREAAAQYARSLRACPGLVGVERADLLERFALASHMADELGDAVDLQEAVKLWATAGDPLREGSALRWLSGLSVPAEPGAGRGAGGGRASSARAGSRVGPTRELASAYVNLTELDAYQQRGWREAAGHAERAVGLAEGLGEDELIHQARFALGLARYLDDDVDRGAAEMDRARTAAERAGYKDSTAFMALLRGMGAGRHRDLETVDADHHRLEENQPAP